jgi:CelD/BcsL family acetyltransferase involved in cellulose biosynthesis
MSGCEVIEFHSCGELRSAATAWDDLWQRSDVCLPLARAEAVAQWVETFTPPAGNGRENLRAIAVSRGGRLVAALPQVEHRPAWAGRPNGLPSNAWDLCGELLIDRSAGPAVERAAMDCLAAALERAWPWTSLAPIAYVEPRWQALLAALKRAGAAHLLVDSAVVGQVPIGPDWHSYQSSWSGNHRRQMRKAHKRAVAEGELTLDDRDAFRADQIEALLCEGFAVEDSGWKGEGGSSVLKTPGMFAWYCRQARQLAGWGQLSLVFLRHEGRAIAFEYGYRAKGAYYSAKVGYDPAYGRYAPGQLLRCLLLERFHKRRNVDLVDFWGPLSEATAKWSTRSYPVGKLVIAPRRLMGRACLTGYRALRFALGRG